MYKHDQISNNMKNNVKQIYNATNYYFKVSFTQKL